MSILLFMHSILISRKIASLKLKLSAFQEIRNDIGDFKPILILSYKFYTTCNNNEIYKQEML